MLPGFQHSKGGDNERGQDGNARVTVLIAAHLGHPGNESMVRQLRLSCCWPKYSTDSRDFEERCVPCKAGISNLMPPMHIRDTSDKP